MRQITGGYDVPTLYDPRADGTLPVLERLHMPHIGARCCHAPSKAGDFPCIRGMLNLWKKM